MADFRIWGTINQTAPHESVVTGSAVPHPFGALEGVVVSAHTAPTRELAAEACVNLVLQMGNIVRERGDRVVDVEAA